MRPTHPHGPLRRVLAALIVVLPLLALVGAGSPRRSVVRSSRERPENPHGKFKGECEQCHGPEGWKPARISKKFDHEKFGFRLDGAHAAASCLGCHRTLDFTSSSMTCASCHEDPHRGEMGTDCARCHSARSFVDRAPMVRAHQLTRFPLSGSHAGLDCESCHPPVAQGQLRFVGTQAECRTCHMEQFRGARDPDHVGGGFSTECQTCHTPTNWSHARFDHQRTGFPLTGAHRAVACTSCHPGGRYRGTPQDCVSCHQQDYDSAQPPHAASGFAASACASCHSTTTWASASFDHQSTAFPLTGAHRTVACTSCHVGGVYRGTSRDCVACHQQDYDTAVPSHPAAGFAASACATCHTTTTWTGATFDHDTRYFRIYRGGHAGRWSACNDCHTVPSNYASFDCLGCHPHSNKAETDSHHSGRSSYRYESTACYSCHSR